jgi:outer membrane protein OmpA-like peptidoglycan-associated protein
MNFEAGQARLCKTEYMNMRKSLKTLLTATAIAALLAAQTASAAVSSRQETAGVGAGAVIGAFAGGPVGFIIGAAIGAKIGDNFQKKTAAIDDLQGSLQQSRGAVSTLESDVGYLHTEISRLHTASHPQLVSLMQAGIDMDLLFRTDEFALTDTTGNRLSQLAATLSAMPEVRVQLDGFADERGDAGYNQALSEKRVEFVRNLLIEAGVKPARIRIAAHGEVAAQDDNIDSYALERRVSIKLFIDTIETLAANPL